MQTSQYHIFSLPPELLESLTPRNLVNKVASRSHTPEPTVITSKSGPRACAICNGIAFLDVEEQRAHFRSDWHRYNVKTRLNGGKTVSEATFAQLIEGLDDSLSGSASSDDEDENSDAVNALVGKTKRLNTRSPSPDSSIKSLPVTALTWFHSPPSTQLGIYRSIFPLETEPTQYLSELKNLQQRRPEGRTWALFMIAGGHFAGAVVRVSQNEDEDEEPSEGQRSRKKRPKRPKPDTEVLLHKTFHRYTTRRKQGGSQSTNDNAKGPANSAGALLRRYGEQALKDDIRGLLQEWKDELVECERIWIRASTSNRRIFYDYDDAPFSHRDERLRTFPFPTRRPTQSELTRCLMELTRFKISHYTEEELREQDEAYLASLTKPKPVPTVVQATPPEKPKQRQPKLSKEEEVLREKWNRMLEMAIKGRLEALKSFFAREGEALGGVDARIPEWTGEKRATLLQLAVQYGHEDMVQWLLEEARADPTIPLPSITAGHDSITAGHEQENVNVGNKSDDSDLLRSVPVGSQKTAYDLGRTKAIRDVFRRCAALHPDWWDWLGAAHVPSALSHDMEHERDEKKKAKRKGLKDRVKEREAKEREKQKDRPITPPVVETKPTVREIVDSNSTSRRLGGGSGAAQGITGLTPEMRAKVERERRARAAEARLKGLQTS
ncbi:VMS1-like protein [Psilocybe cubensis]|uniref:VLRF1 domain-containing protein n=2 Tax=Psilocybe cubensis TaxID=181762 RepID=A0A8H7XW00_PSICU|nr:VMS1-like protein [Psilocybe cubensis]KAH9479650.1 VMS1-like protein [Psilocybe cubensis]